MIACLAIPLAAYVATLVGPDQGYSVLGDGVLGNLVDVVPTLVCLVQAVRVRAQRVPYLLIGLGCAAFAAGDIVYTFYVQFLDPEPYPSVADVGYLISYPLIVAGVIALARPELRGMSRGTLLDGAVSAIACAAAGSILTVRPVLGEWQGSLATKAISAAYPVADLAMTAMIVGVVTLKGGRPSRTWLWLGSGVITFAVTDTVYLYELANNSYLLGTTLDAGWAIGLNLMAIAVLLPYRPGGRAPGQDGQHLVLPNAFSCVAVGILIYGSVVPHRIPVYAVALAVLTLLTAVGRVAYGFGTLRLLALSQRRARTDELTQLPNRRHFYEQVQRALATRAPGDQFSLVMLDLDAFRAINDNFGHQAGDELLRQIGPRLGAGLRPGDVLARLSGDEFAILMPGRDAGAALADAQQLRSATQRPYLIGGTVQSAPASLGVATCPEDGVDLAVLLQRADSALFDAKSRGGGVASFDRVRHGPDQETVNVYQALARRELRVHYQPQFSTGSGELTGAEALVRWQHPRRGLLAPDAFLSFFEHAGLMAELTLEVLEQGARDHRSWRLGGLDIGLSVNLAPSVLLHDDLVGAIRMILARTGLAAPSLTLEITENVLIGDVERSLRTLKELRAEGIQLSLDDYGTGYCSLTYLRDLPLHEIKIDRSFVMDLVPGTPDAAIVASTIQLAQRLGLRTVAEGVETPTALGMLADLGCDVVQGYLLGRPMPAQELPPLARRPQERRPRERRQMVATEPESTR